MEGGNVLLEMADHHHHEHNHTEANEKYFDEHLDLLESEDAKRIGHQAAKAFLRAVPFVKENTTVLDFACGIGK